MLGENPRKWGLRSLFSRVLSQQNGELKKLLDSRFPGSMVPLASVIHTRKFCYGEIQDQLPPPCALAQQGGVLPLLSRGYRGVVEVYHAAFRSRLLEPVACHGRTDDN